ncbi:MAG: hypothetical protein AAF702_26345 [Chloroflexota bacterium]
MNISDWQSNVRERLSLLLHRTNATLPDTAYGLISAAALAPLVSAIAANDPMTAFSALGLVLSGVSGNLLASQFEKWVNGQNQADSDEQFLATLANELTTNARNDAQWRDALDEIHQKIASLALVQQSADDETRAWFIQTLRAELVQLGNQEIYEGALSQIENAGSGAVLVGEGNVAGERGVVAQTIKADKVHTGDEIHHHYGELQGETDDADEPSQDLMRTYLRTLLNECEALPLAAMGATWVPGARSVSVMFT